MNPLLFVSLALATTYPAPRDLDALAAASDAAVYGTVTAIGTEHRGADVWTIATVTAADAPPVRVAILGGCKGSLCMTVPGAPRLAVGETVFVFLRDGSPTGFADGVFHVRGDAGWTEAAAVAVRDGHTPSVQAPLSALLDAAAHLPGIASRPLAR
jgi:hypothetical protein